MYISLLSAFLTNYPEKEEEEEIKNASTRNRTGDLSVTGPAVYYLTAA